LIERPVNGKMQQYGGLLVCYSRADRSLGSGNLADISSRINVKTAHKIVPGAKLDII